jgi:hypothetical protein
MVHFLPHFIALFVLYVFLDVFHNFILQIFIIRHLDQAFPAIGFRLINLLHLFRISFAVVVVNGRTFFLLQLGPIEHLYKLSYLSLLLLLLFAVLNLDLIIVSAP